MRKIKPDVRKAQADQKRVLWIRSGSQCEFEVFSDGGWSRCYHLAGIAAHIFTRPKCGKVRDAVEAVVDSCLICHEVYDKRRKGAPRRVPLWMAQRAWDLIWGASKLSLEAHAGSLGPRPEVGTPPY